MDHPSSRLVAIALLAVALAACTVAPPPDLGPTPERGGSASASTPPSMSPSEIPQVKIAFIEDLSDPESEVRVQPALNGAALALSNAALLGGLPATIDLVPLDTDGDPARAAQIAGEVAADPSFVGAIVAPYLEDQVSAVVVLVGASVPTLSLSSRQPGLSALGLTVWRRLVVSTPEEAAALAASVDASRGARGGVCLLRGPGSMDARWAHLVQRALGSEVVLQDVAPGPEAVPSAIPKVEAAGCGTVVWGGPAEEGAVFRSAMAQAGMGRVELAGGDLLKDDAYLAAAGRAGGPTLATCPCVDLLTSTDLASQRFIQDYQAEHGLAPGSYAVEAWDAARMFVQAVRSGAITRIAVLAELETAPPFAGLANTYAFASDGELTEASAVVHVYRDEGGRWIETSPALEP
jgi:branched-chain amino acid transport system substrate-binding protein